LMSAWRRIFREGIAVKNRQNANFNGLYRRPAHFRLASCVWQARTIEFFSSESRSMVGYAIRALGMTTQFRATFVKVLLSAVLVTVMVETSFAQVMVIAPHPDDEALFASGFIHSAVLAGKNVK